METQDNSGTMEQTGTQGNPTEGMQPAAANDTGGGGGDANAILNSADHGTQETATEQPGASQQQQAAPEAYEPFKIPEDASNVAMDDGVMEGFGALARELNLTQEQAQKVVEFGAKTMHKAIGDGMEAVRAQLEEIRNKWHKEASADPEIMSNIEFAKRATRQFGGEDTGKLFEETGLGSNPAMLRFLIKVGRAIGEAPLNMPGGTGGGAADDTRMAANSLYAGKM